MNGRNEGYQLIGTLNLFDAVPDFVYVIFKKGENYYFQNSDYKTGIINSFELITKDYVIKKIHFLNPKTDEMNNVKEEYNIDDPVVLAFQTTEENHYISDVNGFRDFISEYKTDNAILKKEIDEFYEEFPILKAKRKNRNKVK